MLIAATPQGPIYSSKDAGLSRIAANSPYGSWSALGSFANGNRCFAANSGDTIYSVPASPLLFIQNYRTEIDVSWSCSLTNYLLQTNDSVCTSNWVDSIQNAAIVGGLNQVIYTNNIGAAFFRLKAQ